MQQLAWYASADETVLGVLVADTDGEFSGIVLARDLMERFRAVNITDYFDAPEQAVRALHAKVAEVAADLDRQRREPGQGLLPTGPGGALA